MITADGIVSPILSTVDPGSDEIQAVMASVRVVILFSKAARKNETGDRV
jgi:hypothetical protein